MKRNRWIQCCSFLLCTVLLLCFFCACKENFSADEPPVVTSTEERVGYSYGYANLSLQRFEGWDYEIVKYEEGCTDFGIRVSPEESKTEGSIYLYFSPATRLLGCGTGLSTENVIVAGKSAVKGTYNDLKHWSFIYFSDCTGDYSVHYSGDAEWWSEYGDDAMKILETAEISLGGYPTESRIVAAAETHLGMEAQSYTASFDVTSGAWTLVLDTADGRQTVNTNVFGEIAE